MAIVIKPMTLRFPKSLPETKLKELATEDVSLSLPATAQGPSCCTGWRNRFSPEDCKSLCEEMTGKVTNGL